MSMKEKTSQKMADVLKNLIVPQKLAQKDLDDTTSFNRIKYLQIPARRR